MAKTFLTGNEQLTKSPESERASLNVEPLSASVPSRALGARIGSYILGAFLARGGFGTVFFATHATLGTKAAIKVLHPQLASRPEVVRRFEREIEVIRRINHPNVVKILEHGRDASGPPFLVMELLEGVTLQDHLRVRARIGPAEAIAILEPLVRALEAAHALRVVHRDIKASNVFLASRAEGTRVVLLDFGIAKLLDPTEETLTRSHELLGSFSCMSPEQILNQPVDSRADVYGLGVLAFRMLAGELPFQSNLFTVLRELHLHVNPPPPSTRAPISPAFDDVLLRALCKNPADRHPTVTAFLEDFRAAAEAPLARTGASERARRALAVYAEARSVEPASDEAGDDLGEFEGVLSSLAAELTTAGLLVIVKTGTTVLLSMELPDDGAEDEAARRRTADTMLTVFRRTKARSGAAWRVSIRICFHIGEIVISGQGALVGGDLLDVAGWVPEGADEGVFASPEALLGLGIMPRASVEGAGAHLRISDVLAA